MTEEVDGKTSGWTLEDSIGGGTFHAVIQRIGPDGTAIDHDGDDESALFWRVSCSSGWRSELRPIDKSLGTGPEPPECIVDSLRREWERHVFDTAPLVRIRHTQSEIEALEKALSSKKIDLHNAVTKARSINISWTKIGAAVGISKQAANERWGPSRQ